MRRALAYIVLAAVLAGCPAAMPKRNDPWCAPKVKWNRETKLAVVGVRCDY